MLDFKVFQFNRVLLLCIGLFCCSYPLTAAPRPALYNLDHLEVLRNDYSGTTPLVSFLKRASVFSESEPLSVVSKKHTFAPNSHYYCSLAPYSWPDESNPRGPYVTIDGKINPERDSYDQPKLTELAKRLQYLCVAFYITRDEKYYKAFINHIQVWFIDPETKMLPNLEYAQVSKGKNDNHGMSYGLVDMNAFTPIIESIFLINKTKTIESNLQKAIDSWFASLTEWVINSKQWKSIRNTPNNIVSGCLVTLAEMARIAEKDDVVLAISQEYKKIVLDTQIRRNGKQPFELRRTKGFGYSVKNLDNIVDFCLIMEQAGVKFYKKNHRKIDSAFKYLVQFVGNHEPFPYQQISDWDIQEKNLFRNLSRLNTLSSDLNYGLSESNIEIHSATDVLNFVY